MHILATGVNHRTAPVEVRERLAFRDHNLPDALCELRSRSPVTEVAILSTCNRAELYTVSPEPEAARREVVAFLGEFHAIDPAQLEPHLYQHTDEQAARHLFRVAAGLDSMVLGEGQILGQVRHAMQSASDAGTSRTFLNELFQRSLHIGKRARSETGIHRGAVSISSAAVDLAKNVFGDLRGRRALVIGAGEMSEQTLKHLVDAGVESVIVANRTFQRAVALAEQYGGEAITFDEFPQQMADADIVVSSSAAPHPIVTVDKLRPQLGNRRGRPLFLVDIAVPRDIEPEVGQLPNVYLFDIDDLQGVADKYRAERAKEVDKVQGLVESELNRFMHWLGGRGALPLVKDLRQQVEAVRDAECERFLRKMPELDPREQELVRQMMHSFANKLLHSPTTEIRKRAGVRDESDYVETVRRLFGLDDAGGTP